MSKPSLKFLCSYGGRILPRYPDGKLRYHGGDTRVLSVDRSISFSELLVKLGELCGSSVIVRCQLPTEDLDALVSITSDEDLANLIEEYDLASAAATSSLKIRAFLSAPKALKTMSSPTSPASTSSNDSVSSNSPKSPLFAAGGNGVVTGGRPPRCPTTATASRTCVRHATRPPVYAVINDKAAGKRNQKYAYHYHHCHANGGHVYLIHNGKHWQ